MSAGRARPGDGADRRLRDGPADGDRVVVDASAAYLQRQGLDTLADGAALPAPTRPRDGSTCCTRGRGRRRPARPAAAGAEARSPTTWRHRRLREYPGLSFGVSIDPAATPSPSRSTRRSTSRSRSPAPRTTRRSARRVSGRRGRPVARPGCGRKRVTEPVSRRMSPVGLSATLMTDQGPGDIEVVRNLSRAVPDTPRPRDAGVKPGAGGSSKAQTQRNRHSSCARSFSASWPPPRSPALSPSPPRLTPT